MQGRPPYHGVKGRGFQSDSSASWVRIVPPNAPMLQWKQNFNLYLARAASFIQLVRTRDCPFVDIATVPATLVVQEGSNLKAGKIAPNFRTTFG